MATLIEPPPIDPSISPMENVLELTPLSDIDPDLFTNTRPLWHPPGARGIFGGAAIAQCLSAALRTVPSHYTVHSMHCYFVLAGNAEIPVIYHVERVREGRSFATRTVQARQRGKVIFTTTLSFVREGSAGKKTIQHAVPMPDVVLPEIDSLEGDTAEGGSSPFVTRRLGIANADATRPDLKRTRQWVKARGRISPAGGQLAHLSALAYMSDSYFIGTVARVHDLWRLPALPADGRVADPKQWKQEMDRHREQVPTGQVKGKPKIGMMVSLDHTIYFHDATDFRADDWMLAEMESPWAGDGRGLVFQRIFSKDGKLIATCVQEGLVRLKQDENQSPPTAGSSKL